MLTLLIGAAPSVAHQSCLSPASRLVAPARPAVLPYRGSNIAMQIGGQVACELRKQPKSSVALDITVPPEIANKVHLAVMAELGKNSNVPGFRKGKAPPNDVLLNHVGLHKVKKATVQELIDLGMKQSAQQVQVQAAGEAQLDGTLDSVAEDYSLGEELKFTVLIDVYPDFELKEEDYKGLKVEVERVPFNDEAYEASLLKLRDQNANLYDAPEGAAAQADGQILANMEGFFANPDGSKGDKLPDVAGGDGVEIPLMEGRFMFGLAEGMVGVKKGETREVKVTFPSRTSIPQLAGRDAIFAVTCLKVQTRELPECDDEFASRVSTGMTWEALDAKLREGVQAPAHPVTLPTRSPYFPMRFYCCCCSPSCKTSSTSSTTTTFFSSTFSCPQLYHHLLLSRRARRRRWTSSRRPSRTGCSSARSSRRDLPRSRPTPRTACPPRAPPTFHARSRSSARSPPISRCCPRISSCPRRSSRR